MIEKLEFPSQSKQIRDFGRSSEQKRMTSSYIERERMWDNDAIKNPQRARIRKFFLDNHQKNREMRLLSLPGLHWQFEHSIAVDHPEIRFIGLDWTWGVIELGAPFMPGNRGQFFDIPLATGCIKGIRKMREGSHKISSEWLFCHASTFLSIGWYDLEGAKFHGVEDNLVDSFQSPDRRRNKKATRSFSKRYRRNSAIWLDFTSQLCGETELSMERMQMFCDVSIREIPVAVTVMAARDDYSSHESRIAAICQHLSRRRFRTFYLKDAWTYLHHDVPMLNVAGLLTIRDSIG